ncbi:hypothetical protein BT96DRAFT_951252, partial [Gymnopus androsaceus JB14]
MSSSLTSSVTALPGSKAAVSYARHGYLAVDCTCFESSQSELVLGELYGKDVQRVLSFAAITDVRSSPSLIHLLLPPISCVCGLRIFYESIPSQNATQTSSVSLVPSALMLPSISSWSFITPLSSFKGIRFLHIHWKAINWLHDPGHVAGAGTALEKILQRIDCLEHLVIESRWRFSVKEDILRSLAVYAPNLRTLSLLKLRWFPLFTPPVIENIL